MSANAPVAGMRHEQRPLFGVLFHPEVAHTPRGGEILHNFLFGICKCDPDWTPGHFIEQEVARVRTLVGPKGRAICGLSGGVDSAVAAVLVQRAIADRLTCIFVDHGLLRQGEREQVERTFRKHLGMDLRVVAAGARFLKELQGVDDLFPGLQPHPPSEAGQVDRLEVGAGGEVEVSRGELVGDLVVERSAHRVVHRSHLHSVGPGRRIPCYPERSLLSS